MKRIDLDFCYKEDRNYVHGTDIYKQIVKNLNALGFYNWQYFEVNIKKMCQNNMICFITDEKVKIEGEVVNFILKSEQEQIFGSIVENVNNKIVSRYSFNENSITKYCVIDYKYETAIYRNSENTFSTIDIVISMSKYFVENAVDKSVKWFMRSIKFFRPIEEIELRQIWIKKILHKRNIVVLEIYIGDQIAGLAYGASIEK